MGFFNFRKEFDYFGNFIEVSEISVKSAEYLSQVLNNYEYSKLEEYAKKMHDLENEADSKRHESGKNLAHEFMPPLAREDISTLALYLDDIVDKVEDIMRKIYMFRVKLIRKDALTFASILLDSCKKIYELAKEFPAYKKSKEINKIIIQINTLENKGDVLHAESIRNLFGQVENSADLIAWTKVFDSFENSIDACESAANLVESIITKNT